MRGMSDFLRDSVFYWTFASTGGDAYSGYTVADTAGLVGVRPGVSLPSPHGAALGYYTITKVVDYGVDLSAFYRTGYYTEGATVVQSYFDASTGRLLPTYYGSQGIPTSYAGLGGEFDLVVAAPFPGAPPGFRFAGYDDFGLGGLYLIA